MAIRSNSLPLTDDPFGERVSRPLSLVTPSDPKVSITDDDVITVEHPDGSVTIDLNPEHEADGPEETDFNRNLAMDMEDGHLSSIASDVLEGIDRDEQSRKEWLDTRALGITLLGLKLEKPRTDAGTSSAPLEGMSVVRHPLLLEATVSFQATARAELLPASGPVKVRNDAPAPPRNINQQTNAARDLADSLQTKDDLAQALERDMNHYLTAVATEYVPDTDRMLFYIGFGGDGFKKVYNCPLRRRPVSESIDAEDLIISNAATDLQNCGRVTHRIKMRKSTLKRMQILGVYRDVDLALPQNPMPTAVDKKKEEVSGHRDANKRPEDADYIIYEVYCELDLDEYAPDEFKGKGLPLPYRVTIEKDSRQVLDIRRNWDEDDDQCLAKQFFVQFPFIRGLGFYGLGYIHLLGNTTNALTAAWRLQLDAGMFSNFPGFLFSKSAGRQNTNTFRVAPGTSVGIDVGALDDIRKAIMPLPYKEVGPSFTAFSQHVEEVGHRLASTANIQVGEGKQDAPVGTTLALIEQASKVMDSAHKRLHAAQAEEFKLLKCRFKEDPEAFWRHNKRTTIPWKKEQFIQALNNCELVPVADPNNPTSLHRIAKAMAIKTLQQASPDLYDPTAVDMRIMRIVDIDPEGLFRAAPAPQPPDPRMVAIQQKAAAEQKKNEIALLEAQIKAASQAAILQDKAQDRESRERIEQMKIELEKLRIEEEQIIHQFDQQRIAAQTQHKMQLDEVSQRHKMQTQAAATQQKMQSGAVEKAMDIGMESQHHNAEMQRAADSHRDAMRRNAELHQQKMEHARELAQVKKQTMLKKPKE